MMGPYSRSAAVVGALLVLVTVLVVGCGGSGSGGAKVRTAPDFSGVSLDGTQVSLSEYRGKPLVLAFMASW